MIKEEQKPSENVVPEVPIRVIVNVYNLVHPVLNTVMGAYHTGVVITGCPEIEGEYNFGSDESGGSGLWRTRHLDCGVEGTEYHSSLDMGETALDSSQVSSILCRYRRDWIDSYDMVGRNCNDFTDCICRELIGVGLPDWINRSAKIGTFVGDILFVGPTGRYNRDTITVQELPKEAKGRRVQSMVWSQKRGCLELGQPDQKNDLMACRVHTFPNAKHQDGRSCWWL